MLVSTESLAWSVAVLIFEALIFVEFRFVAFALVIVPFVAFSESVTVFVARIDRANSESIFNGPLSLNLFAYSESVVIVFALLMLFDVMLVADTA